MRRYFTFIASVVATSIALAMPEQNRNEAISMAEKIGVNDPALVDALTKLNEYQTPHWPQTFKNAYTNLQAQNWNGFINELHDSRWAKKNPQEFADVRDSILKFTNKKDFNAAANPAAEKTPEMGPVTKATLERLQDRGFKIPQDIKQCTIDVAGKNDSMCGYLFSLQAQESGFRVSAKAGTSSAVGLTQFTEGTYLEMLAKHGHRLPEQFKYLEGQVEKVSRQTVDGGGAVHSYRVKPGVDLKEVLDLRKDPAMSLGLAKIYAEENLKNLARQFPNITLTHAHLYAAHFLGPAGGRKLIALDQNPKTRHDFANEHFEQAAENNPGIFKNGQANRTIAEVMDFLEQKMGTAPVRIENNKELIAPAPTAQPALTIAN